MRSLCAPIINNISVHSRVPSTNQFKDTIKMAEKNASKNVAQNDMVCDDNVTIASKNLPQINTEIIKGTSETLVSETVSEPSSPASSKKSTTDEEDNSSMDYEEYTRSPTSSTSDYDESSNSSSSNTSRSESSTTSGNSNFSLNTKNNIKTITVETNSNLINENIDNLNTNTTEVVPIIEDESSNKMNPKPFKLILKKNTENKLMIKQPTDKETAPTTLKKRVFQSKTAENQLVYVTLVDSVEKNIIVQTIPTEAQEIISENIESSTKDQTEDIDTKEDCVETISKIEAKEYLIAPSISNEIADNNVIDNATIDDFENDELSSRTSTPKINRELLQLQKTVNESKILTEFMHDSSTQKNRKTRKNIPLKHGDDNSMDLSLDAKAAALRRSRSRSCSKVLDLNEESNDKLPVCKFLGKWNSDEKLNMKIGKNSKKNKDNQSELEDNREKLKNTSEKRSSSVFEGDYDMNIDIDKSMEKWTSDEKLNKRTMRSQNLEFVQKQIKFLNRVNQDGGDITDNSDADVSSNNDSKVQSIHTSNRLYLIEKNWVQQKKTDSDGFCWKCHSCGDELLSCSKCPRSFHYRCLKIHNSKSEKVWICSECTNVENFCKTAIRTGKQCLSQENLNQLLQFALNRAKLIKGHEYFVDIQNDTECPNYTQYIKYPVTLNFLQQKVSEKFFKSSEEFYSESKWIQHNALCYYGVTNKIVNIAKNLVKICRQEVNEIETCGECYLNANTRNDWFVEVCTKPHILLWAKLKGFPFWPAKAMGFNTPSLVNVRFFGDHDRANVAIRECFLYSENNPNPITKQRSSKNSIAECIKEVDLHIEKLNLKFGKFVHAPFKCQYDPFNEINQLEMMIPGVGQYLKTITTNLKRPLTFKIVKTADNNLSMIKKSDENTTPKNLNKSIVNSLNISNDSIGNTSLSSTTTTLTPTIKTITTAVKTQNNLITLKLNKTNNSPSLTGNSNKPSLIIQKITNANEISSTKTSKSNIPVHSLESNDNLTINHDDLNEKEYSTIQDSIKSSPESYEVIPKDKDFPIKKIKKIQSIVIKRRYDNSSLTETTTTTTKKSKKYSEIGNLNVQDNTEEKEPEKILENETINSSLKIVLPTNKRKRSDNENSIQQEKKPTLELNKNSNDQTVCPPLVLLNQQQHQTNAINPTKISLICPNSGIIILPTQTNNSNVSPNEIIQSSDVTVQSTSNKTKTPNIDKLIKNNKSVTITRISSKDNIKSQDNSNANKKLFLLNHNLSEKKTIDNKNKNLTNIEKPISLPNSSVTSSTKPASITKPIPALIFPVPFIEIKTEMPVDNTEKSVDTSNKPSENLNSINTSDGKETTTTTNDPLVEQQISQSSTAVLLPQTDEIKKEIISDDENETSTVEKDTRKENNTDISTDSLNSLQRISVRQFATISCEPNLLGKNNSDQQKKNHSIGKSQIKNVQQKELQRARKSFPNKLLPIQLIPPLASKHVPAILPKPIDSDVPANQNNVNMNINKNLNNMVCIPMDPKGQQQQPQKSIPIPPLTAVTKTNAPSCSFPTTNTTTITNNCNSNITSIGTSVNNHPSSNINNGVNNISLSVSQTFLDSTNQNANSSNIYSEPGSPDHMLSGFVTPSLAAAITDTIVRGPPKLVSRPIGPMHSEGDYVFPVEAGPVSRTLMENAHKMTDFFRSVIEDTIGDMTNNGILEAKILQLQLEIEKLKNLHNKELEELKKNTDLMLCEMRNSMEKEKCRIISETRKQCEIERVRSIEEVKKKQWCTMCGKEAQFYCCWNVSYCDYPCQQKHWPRHMTNCGQSESNHGAGNGDANGSTGQRIGAKISPYNVKEKNSLSNKNKDITGLAVPMSGSIPVPQRMPMVQTIIRPLRMQFQRNPGPISIPSRYNVPLSLPAAQSSVPPYTLINREGNWEVMSANTNYQPCLVPNSGGLFVTDSTGKSLSTVNTSSGSMRPNNM